MHLIKSHGIHSLASIATIMIVDIVATTQTVVMHLSWGYVAHVDMHSLARHYS